MRKTALTLTVSTLVLGIFGAFLRWLQTMSAFDKETGFPIPGAGTTVAPNPVKPDTLSNKPSTKERCSPSV